MKHIRDECHCGETVMTFYMFVGRHIQLVHSNETRMLFDRFNAGSFPSRFVTRRQMTTSKGSKEHSIERYNETS